MLHIIRSWKNSSDMQREDMRGAQFQPHYQ
jgi:hypothetical protein